MPTTDALMIYCTCSNKQVAESIVKDLLDKRLIACANILPAIESHYVWQGAIENSQEILVLIKTNKAKYTDVEKVILTLHPYELPEIIAVPIEAGLPNYIHWINESVS